MATAPNPALSLDEALVDPRTMANPAAMHAVYAKLRAEDPVHWTKPEGYRPFWSVTRHADIVAVEKASDVFVNRLRTYLSPAAAEEWTQQVAGDSHLFRTLVDLDDPLHMKLRRLTHNWFLPANLRKLEARIREIARAHVDTMAAMGGACDFVNEVAIWYPLRVIMLVLGLPPEDEKMMMRMTQEIFGPQDPDVVARSQILTSTGSESRAPSSDKQVDLFQLVQEFFAYFGKVAEDRRAAPRDDLSSVIANGVIDGAPIGHKEMISYYAIAATAGHDTTSSSTAGGMLALIQNPGELAKLKADPSLIAPAVEEMIRWETPVKHFMRTAVADATVGGREVKAGDGLCLWYWSGNRDERVFEDPFTFRVDRPANPQVAFGHGVHLCLGLHLARMEMRLLFEELIPRLETIELAGEPAHTTAIFVSGLKRLPIRYAMR